MTGILVLAVIVLISGATLLAAATPGSPDNPFVTLSYLNDSFRPQIINEIRTAEAELTLAFDIKIVELEALLEAEYGEALTPPGDAVGFEVISLSRDQSLSCSVGAEIMLRIGTAVGVGEAPALVNYTGGETLSSGESLTANHMYLVTIEGNGIRATADTVRVLVRGSYVVNS